MYNKNNGVQDPEVREVSLVAAFVAVLTFIVLFERPVALFWRGVLVLAQAMGTTP